MLTWQCWSENLTETAHQSRVQVQSLAPLEQLNVTNDATDYLFYSTIVVDLPSTTSITLDGWRSNAYIILADGVQVASSFDASNDYDVGNMTVTIPLSQPVFGTFTLTILSVSLGLHNSDNVGRIGSEQESKCVVGFVLLGAVEVTNNGRTMQPFLNGELKQG